jgi:hypothetical protein
LRAERCAPLSNQEFVPDALNLIWGAPAISRFIDRSLRATYHLLENGLIPANKVGDRWVTSPDAIRAALLKGLSEGGK